MQDLILHQHLSDSVQVFCLRSLLIEFLSLSLLSVFFNFERAIKIPAVRSIITAKNIKRNK